MSRLIRSTVEHYLGEWDSPGWAHAFHSLVELGPEGLPYLIERFEQSRNPAFKAELLAIARFLHAPAALGFFEEALHHPVGRVWKAALDGLVDLGSPEAVSSLKAALAGPAPNGTDAQEYRSWTAEALAQARAACADAGEDADR